ncbi:dihydrofolate reductase [Thioclava sp. BHET1]|nr:dihydrofolate reductase [Thioclava sp. BHET1]
MRKLVSAFKVSLDLKFQGPGDYADWVPAWSEDYELGKRIDACLLGGTMYRGYEGYWSAMMAAPAEPSPMTGTIPTPDERAWAARIPTLPHYVLSRDMDKTGWETTRVLRSVDEIAALKAQPGGDIYLMGGGALFRLLADAGLVDELRLITYPIVAGGPHDLFGSGATRRGLEMISSKIIDGGRLRTDYRLVPATDAARAAE